MHVSISFLLTSLAKIFTLKKKSENGIRYQYNHIMMASYIFMAFRPPKNMIQRYWYGTVYTLVISP